MELPSVTNYADTQLVERLEDDGDCLEAIGELIAQGINAGDLKQLQELGIYTSNGLMIQSKRRSVAKITTGSQAALDGLLGGGIETSSLTETSGAVLDISERFGLYSGAVLDIAERFGLDSGAVLDNVIYIDYARAYTYEHDYDLILVMAAKMSEEPFRLLIIGSIIDLFRLDYSGWGELMERQQRVAQILSRTIKIADNFNVTNLGGVVKFSERGQLNDRGSFHYYVVNPHAFADFHTKIDFVLQTSLAER